MTRSAWRGCWPAASSCWSRSRLWSVSNCAIWSAAGRTSAATWSARGTGSGTSSCAARSTGSARGGVDAQAPLVADLVRFSDHASQATLADYLHAHDVLIARRDQVEADLAKLATSAPYAHTIARLRCLRGIDTLSAVGLCAEIGEWGRFDHPDQLSAYLGIVPCEHTTGSQRRLGSITKAGSTHARRLLIEAAYHYRRGPRCRSSARASPTRARTRDHQHLLEGPTPAERSLAPTQRRPAQARRDRRGRCRARARRLLLADRDLPHHQPRTDTHTNDPQETQQLALTNPVSTHPVAVGEAAPAIPARVPHSAFRRLSTHPRAGALDFRQRKYDEQRSWASPRI